MDDPRLDPGLHRAALDGLTRINRASGTAPLLWSAIEHACGTGPLRILEIGSGGGDTLVWMAAHRPRHAFHGIDRSRVAVERARSRSEGLDNVRFFVGDVLDERPAFDPESGSASRGRYDVVMNSLFLHHFDEDDVVNILRKSGLSSRRLVLVEDLVRTRMGYFLAWFGVRILSRSPVVHTDGPRSVSGAFRPSEVSELARSAGLSNIEVTTHWPERLLLTAGPQKA